LRFRVCNGVLGNGDKNMSELKLNANQAALILEVTGDGKIKVEVAANRSHGDGNALAVAICRAIATKLVTDEQFQDEVAASLYGDEGDTSTSLSTS